MDQQLVATKNFGAIAQDLSGSPLGIIGLFVLLVYALSVIAFTSLASDQRVYIIYFVMFFSTLLFGVFSWFEATNPAALLPPAAFKDQDMYERLLMANRRVPNPKALGEIKLSTVTGNVDPKVPKGWFVAGSDPDNYDLGVDDQVASHGKRSAYIKSKAPQSKGFVTLMQVIKAGAYKANRLAMTGYAKSDQVGGWAGFWMRVDGANQHVLHFDNMHDRPIVGTTGWTKYQVVLDVPEDVEDVAFGALLSGSGPAWFDHVEFRTVGLDVPTTDQAKMLEYPDAPANLSFEEVEADGD